LRYHHRAEEDSVPEPGFLIPPTPTEDSFPLSPEIDENDRNLDSFLDIPNEHHTLGRSGRSGRSDGISTGRSGVTNFTGSSERLPGATSGFSDMQGRDSSFCQCASYLRDISFTQNMCKTCGKPYYVSESAASGFNSTQYDYNGSVRSGSTRKNMLKQQGEKQGQIGRKSKNISDEDYMGDIQIEDSRYLSSDDEEFPCAQSPTSWYRYKHARPFPLVDPETHKIVYLKALRAAQYNSMATSGAEFNAIKKIRRPVFSYIPLLKRKQAFRSIGIRPDSPLKIKKGGFMKHIFGDVNPDDFYGNVTVDVLMTDDTDVTQTEGEETLNAGDGTRGTTPVLREHERSSVSLKMRRQGVNFDDT